MLYLSGIILTQVSQVFPTRPEGAEALARGIAPGTMAISNAPCKVGVFKIYQFSTRFLRRNTS